MRRSAIHFIVAVVTFTIGIAVVADHHDLIFAVKESPAEVSELRVDAVPPVPQMMCEVHSVSMFKEEVPILYGYGRDAFLYQTRPDYDHAKTQFPHAARWFYAGCVFNGKSFEEVYVCPKCREAQASWAATPIPESRQSQRASERRHAADALGASLMHIEWARR